MDFTWAITSPLFDLADPPPVMSLHGESLPQNGRELDSFL